MVELLKAPLPKFPLPEGYIDSAEYLRQKVTEGWKYREISGDQYKERMKYEFNVIANTPGFADYFLMVADVVTWAKDNGIVVGPGRGSAAGSLICYLLRITEIDPVPLPMLFERFIDASRDDLPDIDLDFADDRRDEVFQYLRDKYGDDHVANIGTFTRYKGRNSLDDIARVYHIAQWKIDQIKDKLIERADGDPRVSKTIADTLSAFPEFKEIIELNPQIALAINLEGNFRNLGVHAAAAVISSVPIEDICPVYIKDGRRIIAFDKYDAAYLGLLKLDILSLSTLSMIGIALGIIGMTIEDLYNIPTDDPKVMRAFADGDVLGIFQFEGNTTRRICKEVIPTNLQHLSDINALSRPGPLSAGTDSDYVTSKNEGYESDIAGLHPIIYEHTHWTYGHIVYQEQILLILKELGNFEPAQINTIRKVIQYKLGEGTFNKLYSQYLDGAMGHGCTEDEASYIWQRMSGASGYAFNIAHSYSYAKLAYWQMWLKVHHKPAFYAASLIKCGDGKDDDNRRRKLIKEAMRHGINVLPPNLFLSGVTWRPVKSKILAGFTQVKGIGESKAKNIIAYRESVMCGKSNTPYASWEDLKYANGIGVATAEKIKDFAESDDPFDIGRTQQVLTALRIEINNIGISGIWTPTHTSVDIPKGRVPVVFMGIPVKRKYFDAVEQAKKRSKEPITTEEVLESLQDPDLLKYVAIECEDDYGETVFVRVSRWVYPQYAYAIQHMKLGHHVIVAKGFSSDFFGQSVQAKEIAIIDPEG